MQLSDAVIVLHACGVPEHEPVVDQEQSSAPLHTELVVRLAQGVGVPEHDQVSLFHLQPGAAEAVQSNE